MAAIIFVKKLLSIRLPKNTPALQVSLHRKTHSLYTTRPRGVWYMLGGKCLIWTVMEILPSNICTTRSLITFDSKLNLWKNLTHQRLINTVVVFFRPAHFRCCLSSISTRRNAWPIFYDVTSFKSHHGYTWPVSIQSGARVKRKEWMLITTVIPVFQPGIFLPAIQVQFYYVMPVCSGYWCGISCTRCYFMPCKVITYIFWYAWMTTCFLNCTGTSLFFTI